MLPKISSPAMMFLIFALVPGPEATPQAIQSFNKPRRTNPERERRMRALAFRVRLCQVSALAITDGGIIRLARRFSTNASVLPGAQSFSAVRTRTQYVCGLIELSITDTTNISIGPMETSCPYAGIGSWSSGSSIVCKTHPVRSTNLKTRATC